jgi:hypothetical protein
MSRRSTPFAKRFGSVADGLARNPENKRATQRVQDERKGTSVHVGAPFEAADTPVRIRHGSSWARFGGGIAGRVLTAAAVIAPPSLCGEQRSTGGATPKARAILMVLGVEITPTYCQHAGVPKQTPV